MISDSARVAIIIVAAGSGTRLGASVPKAFVDLGGLTLLQRAVRTALQVDGADIVVVVPGDRVEAATSDVAADRVHVIAGSATRQESVAAGLAHLQDDVDVVLVHDAARPLTPIAVFERVLAAVRERGGGIIPVLPVVDTVKRVADHVVLGEVDRSSLVAVQTPQAFERTVLVQAMADIVGEHTDDASVLASSGHAVTTVAGDPRAHKITTADDLDAARLRVRAERALRTGLGTDVHAFGGGELWLAGLHWPGERGLSGHSDGDAVAHAIVDALLSAAGLGDIGTHFGTSRPEFAGAHADVFLTETRRILATDGWRVENVAVQVQCAAPRIAPRRAEAERVLSAALGAPVSVSATTTDGLGFTGRGAGVQAFATALIVRD